jgi:hypothetical protein
MLHALRDSDVRRPRPVEGANLVETIMGDGFDYIRPAERQNRVVGGRVAVRAAVGMTYRTRSGNQALRFGAGDGLLRDLRGAAPYPRRRVLRWRAVRAERSDVPSRSRQSAVERSLAVRSAVEDEHGPGAFHGAVARFGADERRRRVEGHT